jgi:peptidoglycan/xylan/chitin deacetylase (PgdA/CDA1 family)
MYRDMVRLAMRAPVEKREELLRQLRRWCAAPAPRAPSDRPLTCAELRSLAESRLVTIGAHAVSHASLTALPEQEQASEILSSKARLQEILGREVNVFSYPFGSANDCSATTARLCKAAGFRKAATAWPGQHYRWSDPLRIPRNFIQDFDLDSFVVKVKSFWI